MSLVMGFLKRLERLVVQADLIGGVVQRLAAEDTGSIVEFGCVVQVSPTTTGTLTLAYKGTNVNGGVITVPAAAVVGAVYKATLVVNDATRLILLKDDAITITPAGFTTAGQLDAWLDINQGNVLNP